MIILIIPWVDTDSRGHLLLGVVLIPPPPEHVRPVASALHPALHDLLGDRLHVISPADLREEVNESRGEVEAGVSEFSGLIVPREGVVVVVEAFSQREECHAHVFGRLDALVVRLVTPLVGGGVHEPSHVENEGVAEHGGYEERVQPGLAPKVHGDYGRHHEAGERHQKQVVSDEINILFKYLERVGQVGARYLDFRSEGRNTCLKR